MLTLCALQITVFLLLLFILLFLLLMSIFRVYMCHHVEVVKVGKALQTVEAVGPLCHPTNSVKALNVETTKTT